MSILPKNIVAQNRKARHNYIFDEEFEAGIVLKGSEVKSLREGKSSIVDCYATDENGELFLINCYIPEYLQANRLNHLPRQKRKLLLHKRQINKLIGKIKLKGYSLVALSIYFNEDGRAKVGLGLGKGRKEHDKRERKKELDLATRTRQSNERERRLMSSFDKELIKKLARLARVRFSDQELNKFSQELAEIWDVIISLQQVDTASVEPVYNVNDEGLRLRLDQVTDGGYPDEILANCKHQNFNCFTVPKVVE